MARDGAQLWVRALAAGRVIKEGPVDKGATFSDGALLVFSTTSILPDPAGGLTVGPQTVRLHLFRDCDGNLVLQKAERETGLTLLILPGSRSSTHHVTFKQL